MRYEKTVVDSCPAYDVILPRKCTLTGYPVFKNDDEIAVKFPSSRYPKMFTFGSVVSFALEMGDDPIESYKESLEAGHKLHWLNANCVTISAMKEARKEYYFVEIGDKVMFEGVLFLVEKSNNDNLELVRIGTQKEIINDRMNAV